MIDDFECYWDDTNDYTDDVMVIMEPWILSNEEVGEAEEYNYEECDGTGHAQHHRIEGDSEGSKDDDDDNENAPFEEKEEGIITYDSWRRGEEKEEDILRVREEDEDAAPVEKKVVVLKKKGKTKSKKVQLVKPEEDGEDAQFVEEEEDDDVIVQSCKRSDLYGRTRFGDKHIQPYVSSIWFTFILFYCFCY